MTAVPPPPAPPPVAAAVGATPVLAPNAYVAFKKLRLKYQFEYRRPYPLATNADFDKFEPVSAVGDEILKCLHFDMEFAFAKTAIPEDLYHEIDWDLWFKHQQSMYLPLKASAVGDARFLVRRVSAMNWPTFCALFGNVHTAEDLNVAWLACPIVRTAHHRGTAHHRRPSGGCWRQKGGKKGGKGGGKGPRK